MKVTRVTVAITIAFGTPLAAQQVTPVRTITLQEAVDLSVRNQPAMVQARQDIRVAGAQELQTRAAFLPSLTSNAQSSISGGSRVNQFGVPTQVDSYYSSSFGLTAGWDVFTGFRRGAQRRSAQATEHQREATLRRTEYGTALATKQAFFLALASQELVGVNETRLRRAEEQLTLTTERLRLGATTRSDSLRARVEAGNAQLALITARNTLRNAQASLARQIQVEGLVMAQTDSGLFVRLGQLDTAQLMREALASAPSVLEAEAAVSTARANRSASRATYLPTMSLGGGYTFAAGDPSVQTPFNGRYASGWNARVTLSYPLFNNLTRETNIIQTDAAAQSALARARDARLQVSASLLQQFAAFEAAAARIAVSQVSVAAAEEDLRMQRERYRLGAVTQLEVTQSTASLDQAQVDLVQARYDYLLARAQIEAIIGRAL